MELGEIYIQLSFCCFQLPVLLPVLRTRPLWNFTPLSKSREISNFVSSDILQCLQHKTFLSHDCSPGGASFLCRTMCKWDGYSGQYGDQVSRHCMSTASLDQRRLLYQLPLHSTNVPIFWALSRAQVLMAWTFSENVPISKTSTFSKGFASVPTEKRKTSNGYGSVKSQQPSYRVVSQCVASFGVWTPY